LNPTLKGWLELVRPPNLFTVPGDPIVGFILAGGSGSSVRSAVWVALAAILLYMAGLIGNDCADAAEDQHSRPQRPIPSGRVKRKHAFAATGALAIAGIATAWQAGTAAGLTALLLTGMVMTYNFTARRHVVTSVVTMGFCRGLSVMLGATAALEALPDTPLPWLAAGGLTLYIIAVSILAHGETRRQRLGIRPWLPPAAAALLFVALGQASVYSAGLAIIALTWLMLHALGLRGEPEPADVQRTIGCMIRSLLLLQAGLCALMPVTGLPVAMVLLAAWPLAAVTGRMFYGS